MGSKKRRRGDGERQRASQRERGGASPRTSGAPRGADADSSRVHGSREAPPEGIARYAPLLGGVALILIGLGLGAAFLLSLRPEIGDGPGTSHRGATGDEEAPRAPTGTPGSVEVARPDPPLSPPEFTQPELITGWPTVTGDAAALLESGRRRLSEAGNLYAEGSPRALAAGDQALLRGLDELYRAGAVVPELRALHHETVNNALRAGDTAEGERRTRLWLRSFPDDLFALRLLGNLRFNARDWSGAHAIYERLLARRPHDAEVLPLDARALWSLGRWAECADAAARAAALAPADVELRRLLTEACFELGDKDRGVQAARALLTTAGYPTESALARDDAEAVFKSAIKMLHRYREYDELLAVAAAWRSKSPDDLEAITAEGSARLHTGDPAAAVPLLERALADPANREEVSFELGLALLKSGRPEEALHRFAALLVDAPWHSKAAYQIGQCLSRLERVAEAEAFFERSRRLAPSDREWRRATELAGAGRSDLAAVARARAWRLRDAPLRALEVLGIESTGAPTAALLEALDIEIELRRPREARALVSRIESALGASSALARGSRARVDHLAGSVDEAIEALRSLTDSESSSTGWSLRLGEWLLEAGRLDAAITTLAAVRASAADREASWLLARARLAAGDAAAALALLESVSSGDTRWDEWRMDAWLALARVRAGDDPRRALRELDSIPATRRGSSVEWTARLEALEALSTSTPSRELDEQLSAARERKRVIDELAPQISELARRVAALAWRESSKPRLELARTLHRCGDRATALAEARLAAAAEADDVEPLRALVEWLDRADESFERIAHLRRWVELAPGDEVPRRALAEAEIEWGLRPREANR